MNKTNAVIMLMALIFGGIGAGVWMLADSVATDPATFQLGYEAAIDGLPVEAFPGPSNSLRRIPWVKGWQKGFRERSLLCPSN